MINTLQAVNMNVQNRVISLSVISSIIKPGLAFPN